MIRSPEIARQVTSLLDDISADGSYKLPLDAHDRIVLVERRAGRRADLAHGSGNDACMQRFTLELLAPFAPEEML